MFGSLQVTGNARLLWFPVFTFLSSCQLSKPASMQHKIFADSNQKTISIHKGDTITIELDETPTAGYNWEIEHADSAFVHLQSSEYKLRENTGIGGGGIRTMVFIVSGKGSESIKLKNAQRWSGDVYQRFELNIIAE